MTPEQIHAYFGQWPPLKMVYGAIAYYLNNIAAVEAYIERGEAAFQETYRRHLQQPESEVAKRLRTIKVQKIAAEAAVA